MMKNKYIEELNNIQADSAFKKQMIEKMYKRRKPIIDFSNIFVKTTLVCSCACLIFISVFTYKTYQETQYLKEQLASANKQIERLYNRLNEKDLDSLMIRNDSNEEMNQEFIYSNPLLAGGMGNGGDVFPGMQLDTLDPSDFVIVDETNQFKELPVGKKYKHVFTLKEKKEIIYQLIDNLNIENYDIRSTKNYIALISDAYSIEIKNEQVIITNKLENKDIDVENFIKSNAILFNFEYEMETYDSSKEREYVVLYEKTEDNLIDLANVKKEIRIEIKYSENTVICIDYSEFFEPVYYPTITYQKALNQLQKEECYFTEGMKDYTDINKIYCARLMYMFDMNSETWLPYYQFFVGTKNLDLAEERGFIIDEDEYILTVFIPAIGEEYIEHKKDYEIDIMSGMAQ